MSLPLFESVRTFLNILKKTGGIEGSSLEISLIIFIFSISFIPRVRQGVGLGISTAFIHQKNKEYSSEEVQ